MTRSVDLIVIGGGIVGVSVAHCAAARGAQVLVLERGQIGQGCSYGNAGLIAPSFSLPLARPGTIRNLPRILLGRQEGARVKPRPDLGWARWMLAFLKSCAPQRMKATIQSLSRLGEASVGILERWSAEMQPFGFRQRGWLHGYQTRGGLERARGEARILREAGVESRFLNAKEIRSLEPDLSRDWIGGVFFPNEAEVDPYALVTSLGELAQRKGVALAEGTAAVDFEVKGGRIAAVETTEGTLSAGDYVVAAGSWSRSLVKGVIGWLPIEPAKGHSVTTEAAHRPPALPLLMGEDHIVLTAFDGQMRLTTGLDLVGFNPGVDPERIEGLQAVGSQCLHHSVEEAAWQSWSGLRPMTPDGRPLIGRFKRIANLWIASGHGQRGMTLAPVTGELLAELLVDGDPPIDPGPLSPERYGL